MNAQSRKVKASVGKSLLQIAWRIGACVLFHMGVSVVKGQCYPIQSPADGLGFHADVRRMEETSVRIKLNFGVGEADFIDVLGFHVQFGLEGVEIDGNSRLAILGKGEKEEGDQVDFEAWLDKHSQKISIRLIQDGCMLHRLGGELLELELRGVSVRRQTPPSAERIEGDVDYDGGLVIVEHIDGFRPVFFDEARLDNDATSASPDPIEEEALTLGSTGTTRPDFLSPLTIDCFPNPMIGGTLSLQFTRPISGTLQVCGSGGSVLVSESLQSITRLNLDLENLAAGVYVVKVVSQDGEVAVKRIVKAGG